MAHSVATHRARRKDITEGFMKVQVQDQFGAPWSVPGAIGAPKATQGLVTATGRAILGSRAMVTRAVDFLHVSGVRRSRIMTGGTQGLNCTVIHPLGGKRGSTAMAQGTFVTRHPCGRYGRYMVGGLDRDAGIGPGMAGLTSTCCHTGVFVGRR